MINTETNKKDALIARIGALGAPAQPGFTHFDVPVTTGSDDAEERASGTVNLTSTTLELVTDTRVQKVGVRFAGLTKPVLYRIIYKRCILSDIKMKTSLLHPFETIPYFTLEGFKQATGMDSSEQVRVLLHRWTKAGHILQLKRGVYMTRRFHEQHGGDYLFSSAVSAILMPQSYLSLEFVLQGHNLLTDVTYPVTCITTKNTRRIINQTGTFWYRHIREDLYRGFTITEYFGIRIARASAAKALFDYLYLRPLPAPYRSPKFNLAEELRLNLDEFSEADREEFSRFVGESGSRKMMDVLNNYRSNPWQP